MPILHWCLAFNWSRKDGDGKWPIGRKGQGKRKQWMEDGKPTLKPNFPNCARAVHDGVDL